METCPRQYSSSLSIVSVVDIKPTSVSKHYIWLFIIIIIIIIVIVIIIIIITIINIIVIMTVK